MSDLLPCPFCGENDLRCDGDDHFVGFSCRTCGASGPNHYGSYDWNTRTPPPGYALVKLEGAEERVARLLVGTIQGTRGVTEDVWGKLPEISKKIYLDKAQAAIRALTEEE